MDIEKDRLVFKESVEIQSEFLGRVVLVDYYIPSQIRLPVETSLLLINDGQDMVKLGLEDLLEGLLEQNRIAPLICVGIHAGLDRKMEYGTAGIPDYKKRGSKAKNYTDFIFHELIPCIRLRFPGGFSQKAFAGFSLGALSALDIVWNYPQEFSKIGAFSGSFWWRTKDGKEENYSDETDRIMHHLIRSGGFHPWLKFFFECGTADESEDRNQNGIIDSIDDTLDLVNELLAKGYARSDIEYLQINNGRHDVATWALAMPHFLEWGWGRKANSTSNPNR